jgi:hypothetical protein
LENFTQVIFSLFLLKIGIFSFSYRLKPNPYGIKALFGIYLGQIDDSKIISGIIRVGDLIHVIQQELDFWEKK